MRSTRTSSRSSPNASAPRSAPCPITLPDYAARALDAIVGRRRQIIDMITAENNRLGFTLPAVRKGIKKHIHWLERQLSDIDSELDELIRKSPVWRAKSDLLRDVPGVGPNLARTLIAELPKLGRLSHKEIAALVGVAPLAGDSGLFRGKRMIWGGRASAGAPQAPAAPSSLVSLARPSENISTIESTSRRALRCRSRLRRASLTEQLNRIGVTEPPIGNFRTGAPSPSPLLGVTP